MQSSLTTFNPFLSWLEMASAASASFFPSSSPGPSTAPCAPMTEIHAGHSLYVPATAPRRGAPLLVMLHGAGQDPADFAAGTAMNSVAERHGFIVLYPGQPTSANAHRCWNWFERAHHTRHQGDPARIASLTLQIAREHRVDPDRIYIAGLSAGGSMAALLGDLFPEIYAAVGVHSGLAARAGVDLTSGLAALRGAPREASEPREMPTIVFHGDKDSVVHAINGTHVIEASFGIDCAFESFEQTGPDGRRFTRRNYVSDGSGIRGEHWTLHDASHAWSGGSLAGSFADPLGPDASEEMLRFFETQRRDPSRALA
ncbi:extracellular catalytic domain type 1 short-chain-length polyhydroxyalkanoate depolymerase [Variovorax sp. GT1P44]|uniref:extracellular catalytic domain type 1 short-chain-length polyhydroxyalkanoate depolymerase n=1 Tax=Variovorax sp. GT1P44 TaxID=3443742 RepID=UPI003F48ED6D